jgi:adenosylhomocysteine nucleosidase
MTIGILCATPEELQALHNAFSLPEAPQRFGPSAIWQGIYRGHPMALAQCGIGKVNAAAAATLLVTLFQTEVLIFSGVAGGLAPELKVGDVLLAERLDIHDFGYVAGGELTPTRSGILPIGAPQLTELARVPDEVAKNLEHLRARVAPKLGHAPRLGSILTADYFLNCATTRDYLRRQFRADAIDMESGAVNQIAQGWGVPLYVIRTLSDRAGEDSHLTYSQMAAFAARNSALCVTELLDILL